MSLAEDVIKKMAGRTVTLSTCESLTGGGIGAALTSVPGASAVFRGALVTYARELKASLAGVDEELIANEGVVNELTALQMALGARPPAVPTGPSPPRASPARPRPTARRWAPSGSP